MSEIAAIDRLRRIAQHLVCDVDGEWFAATLAEYEAGARHGLSLDQALGLRPAAGERPWWEREARERRDEIIRTIAAKHFPGLSRRAAAKEIVRELGRYQATTWRQHRAHMAPPEELRGTLRADLFRLLKLDLPITERIAERSLVRHEIPPIDGARIAARSSPQPMR